jgi:Sulfotransferase domain
MGALVWLASFPKSGNTWMRVFLHNLLKNPKYPLPINEINRYTLGDSQASWYGQVTQKPAPDLTLEDLAALRPKVHRAMMAAHPDSVFVKTHSYMGESHGVPLITMECTAGAIYILRNPLDVVLSYADHLGLSIDDAIVAMAREGGLSLATETNVTEFVNSWSTHVKSWTQAPHPGLHVMRYEDMLDKPVKTFSKVAKFLGLKPSKERVLKAIRFSSFKEMSKQEEKTGFKERSVHAERFFRSGKKNQWRDKLTEDQVHRIVDYHREQMQRFGYVPKGY